MKLKHVLAAGIPLLGIVIAGCGGGGGGGSSSTTTTTTISSAADASKTSSSGTQAASTAANSATSLSGLAAGAGAPKFRSALANKNPRLAAISAARERAMKFGAASYSRAKAAGMQAPTTTYCSNVGGSYSSELVANPDSSYRYTLIFTNCSEGDVQMNGTMTMDIGASSITMKTGNGDSNVEATDFVTTYYSGTTTTVLAVYTSSMTVTGTFTGGGATGADTFNYTGNGVERYAVGTTDTYNFAMTNFSMAGTATVGVSTSSYSITIGGTVTDSWSGTASGSSTVTYTNLALSETTDSATYSDWSINGTIAMGFVPASCFDGTFTFTTVTAVYENLTTGRATAGEIDINDNVRIVFKLDGTVDVYYNNALVQNYTEADLDRLCPISAPL